MRLANELYAQRQRGPAQPPKGWRPRHMTREWRAHFARLVSRVSGLDLPDDVLVQNLDKRVARIVLGCRRRRRAPSH